MGLDGHVFAAALLQLRNEVLTGSRSSGGTNPDEIYMIERCFFKQNLMDSICKRVGIYGTESLKNL